MRVVWFIASALAALLLPGGTWAAETVSIGIVGAASDVIPYLAQSQGFLRAEGLDANILSFDSAAKMVAPLGAGQLDVGTGAWSAGLFNAAERGIGIRIVADKATNEAPYDYRVVIVRKPLMDAHAIRSFADLKGRKIGITAQGASDNSALAVAMATAGLTVADVERVYLGFSAQLVALGNGGIDAAFSAEPDATLAVREGIAAKFAPYSSFYPVWDSGIVIYGTNFIERHRDTGEKFMRAYLRAARFYDDALRDGHIAGPHADAIIRALVALTKQQDESVFREMVAPRPNPDGRIDRASLEKDLAFFKSAGDVAGDITAAQILDSSFVDKAVAALGPWRHGS